MTDVPPSDIQLLYRRLLGLRREHLMQHLPGTQALGADVLAPGAVSARWRLGNGSLLRIDLNLSDRPVVHTPQADAALLFEHPAQSADLLDRGTLAPYCALVSLSAAAQPPDGERP